MVSQVYIYCIELYIVPYIVFFPIWTIFSTFFFSLGKFTRRTSILTRVKFYKNWIKPKVTTRNVYFSCFQSPSGHWWLSRFKTSVKIYETLKLSSFINWEWNFESKQYTLEVESKLWKSWIGANVTWYSCQILSTPSQEKNPSNLRN